VHVIASSGLVVLAAGWASWAEPGGFRYFDWTGGLRAEVPKVAADSCVGEPVAQGRLAPAALAQFRRVSRLILRSAATDLIVASGRDSYSATASDLNSDG